MVSKRTNVILTAAALLIVAVAVILVWGFSSSTTIPPAKGTIDTSQTFVKQAYNINLALTYQLQASCSELTQTQKQTVSRQWLDNPTKFNVLAQKITNSYNLKITFRTNLDVKKMEQVQNCSLTPEQQKEIISSTLQSYGYSHSSSGYKIYETDDVNRIYSTYRNFLNVLVDSSDSAYIISVTINVHNISDRQVPSKL